MSPSEIDQLEDDMNGQLRAGIRRNTVFFGFFMVVLVGFMIGMFFTISKMVDSVAQFISG